MQRALDREKEARKYAEKILEDKSRELYFLSEELRTINIKLENLLKEKTSQLKGVFENFIDAYLLLDLNGNVLSMNEAATDIFKYDVNKEKLNVVSLIYPEDKIYALKSFSELKEKGSFSNYTSRILCKDKNIKWVQINASLIYGKNKKPMAIQGVVRNITALKSATELIEQQKKELDVIVENSSLGIALTQQGYFLKTNKVFQNLLGYSENELSRLRIDDITFKEDLSISNKYLDKIRNGEIDSFALDKRYKRKNGSILWAKINVNAVRDSLGVMKYKVIIVEDVTLEREKALIVDMINDLAKSILGKDNIYEIAWEVTQKNS
jgi:PAS domain S-box-containing protein